MAGPQALTLVLRQVLSSSVRSSSTYSHPPSGSQALTLVLRQVLSDVLQNGPQVGRCDVAAARFVEDAERLPQLLLLVLFRLLVQPAHVGHHLHELLEGEGAVTCKDVRSRSTSRSKLRARASGFKWKRHSVRGWRRCSIVQRWNVKQSKQTTTVTPAYQPVDQTSQQTDQINHLSTRNNPLKQVSNWSS